MIKELFSEQIAAASEVVRDELGMKSHQRLVAVQHKYLEQKNLTQVLASALDEVAIQRNATVVFFAAGTVPNHDSFHFYQRVKELMKEDAIVHRAENLWKVVGLIS